MILELPIYVFFLYQSACFKAFIPVFHPSFKCFTNILQAFTIGNRNTLNAGN
jgi:hypothetical protein